MRDFDTDCCALMAKYFLRMLITTNHSVLKLFTGFAIAAFMD